MSIAASKISFKKLEAVLSVLKKMRTFDVKYRPGMFYIGSRTSEKIPTIYRYNISCNRYDTRNNNNDLKISIAQSRAGGVVL